MAAAPARRAPARKPAPARRPVPVKRPAPARKSAPPTRAQAARLAHPRGAAVLDNLLYGRGWIALVFVLLAGIVFFNVDLLQMNRDIATTAEKAGEVKRENARLRTEIAKLGSSERIQQVALEAGLVMPAPGEVRYLRSNPSADAERAAKRIEDGSAAVPVAVEPVIEEAVIEEPVVTEPVEAAPVEPEAVAVETPVGVPTGQ